MYTIRCNFSHHLSSKNNNNLFVMGFFFLKEHEVLHEARFFRVVSSGVGLDHYRQTINTILLLLRMA